MRMLGEMTDMCEIVEVYRADGKRILCENKRELWDALGVEPIRLPTHQVWCEYDCLCPCDMKATAKAAGYALHRSHGGDYLMAVKYESPNAALSGAEPALSAERPLEGTVMQQEE